MSSDPVSDKVGARRADLAEKIADHLLREGLSAATLRPLATAAGLSDRMLIYYFKTRDAAIAAGLQRAAARLAERLTAASAPRALPAEALVDRLTPFILDDAQAPIMTLWLEIAARAARGEAPYTEIAPAIAAGFLDWVKQQLDAPDEAVDAQALAVLARLDGLALLKAAGLKVS
jgi:AcrR family transcriptional regulator